MKQELEKYAELIISMSTDYLLGKITGETYVANLKMIAKDNLKVEENENKNFQRRN
jgi:hypothetical protein